MKKMNEILDKKDEREVVVFNRHNRYVSIEYDGDVTGALEKFGSKSVPFYETYDDIINVFI